MLSNGAPKSLDNYSHMNHNFAKDAYTRNSEDLIRINKAPRMQRPLPPRYKPDYSNPSKPYNFTAGVENFVNEYKQAKADVLQGVKNYKLVKEVAQDAFGLYEYIKKVPLYAYALPAGAAAAAAAPYLNRYGHGLYRDGLGGHNLAGDFLQELG